MTVPNHYSKYDMNYFNTIREEGMIQQYGVYHMPKTTGLDFANIAAKYKRNRNQRSISYYRKRIINARYQLDKYKKVFK